MINPEYQEISEKEIWNGENKSFLILENIVFVIAVGEQTDELAKAQKQTNLKLASRIKGKVNYLIDLNKCGKNSPEAREIWKEICEEDNTDKVGIFGLHPVAKVLASFVTRITKKNNQQFFSTKEEALMWLKGTGTDNLLEG
jgi:hypothetical protein